MVEVYPSGTGVENEVGVGVGGKRVDRDAGVGLTAIRGHVVWLPSV